MWNLIRSRACARRGVWPAGQVLAMASVGLLLTGCPGAPQPDDGTPDTVPDFQAAAFTNSTQIDNPYFPLVPGTTWTYSGTTEDGVERVVVDVLEDTREVAGITCREVRDQVFLDDVLVEDTLDWYAQDDAGNVWYMGEDVDNYNYDAAGNLIEVTHEGSWTAGSDVADVGTTALPGYQMPAAPSAGGSYHQEYYRTEAEDMAEVVALNVAVTLTGGVVYTCLQTRDFNPLDSAANEYKYYAPGVGLVLEEAVAGGERVELVSVEP